MSTTTVTVKDLLDAGVHFGHPTRRWNPKMKPYIYGPRNGIYIIDLTVTMRHLQTSCQFLYDQVVNGGTVLFVGTKRQSQELVREAAERTGMFFMCERWLGGTLTNFRTIRRSVADVLSIQKMEQSGELAELPKKEGSRLRREFAKKYRNLVGITEMKDLPTCLVVIDSGREYIAVNEARRLKLPVVALVDTNCDPDPIDYVIPANDDAVRSVKVILDALCGSIMAAKGVLDKKHDSAEAEAEAAPGEAGAAAEGDSFTFAPDDLAAEMTGDRDEPATP